MSYFQKISGSVIFMKIYLAKVMTQDFAKISLIAVLTSNIISSLKVKLLPGSKMANLVMKAH